MKIPWYCVSIFIFCLEPTIREQLDENNFTQYYGIFFESTIPKVLDHSYVQSSFATITRHFDNGIWKDTLQLKVLRTWIAIWASFFLSKYLKTKIGEGPLKIIIYTVIWACFSKNIVPRHVTYFCMLLFLLNKPSL